MLQRVVGARVSGTGSPAKRESRASADLRLAVPPPADQAFFPELPGLLEVRYLHWAFAASPVILWHSTPLRLGR